VTLDILDGSGAVVRHYASTDPTPAPKDEGNIPWWWIRPLKALSASVGMHRFTWDLHYPPAPGSRNAYPIAATPHDTAPGPTSPWVVPSVYELRLSADGKTYKQWLTVDIDPRVKTLATDLQQQFALSKEMYDDIGQLEAVSGRIRATRANLRAAAQSDAVKALRKQAAELSGAAGEEDDEAPPSAAPDHETLSSLTQSLRALLRVLQADDSAPTTQLAAAVEDRRHAVAEILGRVQAFETAVKAGKVPEAPKR